MVKRPSFVISEYWNRALKLCDGGDFLVNCEILFKQQEVDLCHQNAACKGKHEELTSHFVSVFDSHSVQKLQRQRRERLIGGDCFNWAVNLNPKTVYSLWKLIAVCSVWLTLCLHKTVCQCSVQTNEMFRIIKNILTQAAGKENKIKILSI